MKHQDATGAWDRGDGEYPSRAGFSRISPTLPTNPTSTPSSRTPTPGPPHTVNGSALGSPDPACATCKGAGFWLYDVPYGHALFGVAQRCQCLDAALSQARQERLAARAQELTAQLHREMGKLAALELGTLDRSRHVTPIEWRGNVYNPVQQLVMLARALNLAESFEPMGEGLYIYGPNGTGKSHLVAAILNRATQQGIAARYGHAPALLRVLRQGFRDNSADDRLEALAGVTLLAIDDLGAEAPGDWATAVLFDLLKSRDAAGLTTLITSNLPLDALNDPRIVSLIQGNSLVVPLILSDYRALHQGGSGNG